MRLPYRKTEDEHTENEVAGSMETGKKKIISLLLVLTLLLSLLPAAFAEEPGTEELALQSTEDSDPPDTENQTGEKQEQLLTAEEGGADSEDEAEKTDPGVASGNEEGVGDGNGMPEDTGTTESGAEKPIAEGTGSESGEDEAENSDEDEGQTIDDEKIEETEIGEGENEDEKKTGEEIEEEKELPYGFAGMPEGYELSDTELAAKAALLEHGIPDSMEECDYVEYSVLLATSDADYAATVAAAYSADLVGFYDCFAELQLTTATAMEAVTAAADPDIPLPAVEPNWIIALEPSCGGGAKRGSISIQSTADDPYEWDDWVSALGLDDPLVQNPSESEFQWMHDAVNSYAAWGVTMGSGNITVAVLDTGIATGHEDFGVVLPGTNTLSKTITTDVEDDAGHGTHVSGIIAAQGFNGKGGVGIAPGVAILPIKIMSGTEGSTSAMIRGINWAVENGADIINMSLGGVKYNSSVEAAINTAYEAGVTVIAAMANNYYGGSNIRYYPAAYDHVIGVGATDQSGNRANYSHYGSWCDVYAPGSDIWSCWLNSRYRSDSGTSMACPVVAGIAALYMSVYGKQDPDTMERVLKNTAGSNGVIDASKLFSSDRTAPLFTAAEADGSEIAISKNTVKITSAGHVFIAPAAQDDNARILYTLDGKKPSMLNGEIRSGTLLPTGEGISFADYEVGQTVTVTAVKVSGLGVAGKYATLKVKIITPTSEEEKEQISVEITELPQKYLVAGRTWQLRGRVVSSLGTAVDQKLVWSIVQQDEGLGASINASTGVLSTKAGKSGTVRVRAVPSLYPENPGAEAEIMVQAVPMTSAITLTLQGELSKKTVTLIATCKDSRGNILDNDDIGLRWTSSNPKVATVDENGVVTSVGKGSATIKVKALDGSGKTASRKITVHELVSEIVLSGQELIAPGASATIKATVRPSAAHNKSVTWSIRNCTEENADIRISSAGKVTVGKSVPIGTSFEVVATAKDGSGTESEAWVMWVMPKATSVTVIPWEDPHLPIYSKGKLTGAILYRMDLPQVTRKDGTVRANNELSLDVRRNYGSGDAAGYDINAIVWSSSNSKVATVDSWGNVTAAAVGTTTITARANDGSGKSAKFTIKVINPVSSLQLISAAPLNCEMLAFGRSVKTNAALGSTYGKPGMAALKWSFLVSDSGGWEDEELTALLRTKKLVTLSSSGKLTVKAGAKSYGAGAVTVTAETTDGTGLADSVRYDLAEGTTKVQIWEYSPKGTAHEDLNLIALAKKANLPMKITETYYIVSDGLCEEFTVKSSNPKVAGAVIKQGAYYDSRGVRRTFVQLSVTTGVKTGSAKITVTACDGTGKSTSITIRVAE